MWIPLAAGLEDGVSPCALLTCAVFLVVFLWSQHKGLNVFKALGLFFCVFFVLTLLNNFGVTYIVLKEGFEGVAINGCYVLAIVFAVLGIVFVYDWVLLLQGKAEHLLLSRRLLNVGGSNPQTIYRVLGILSVPLALLTTAWPMNYHMAMAASDLYMPGKFLSTGFTVFMYTLMCFWLVILCVVLFLKGSLTLRLRQMICAAVFLSASLAVLLIF